MPVTFTFDQIPCAPLGSKPRGILKDPNKILLHDLSKLVARVEGLTNLVRSTGNDLRVTFKTTILSLLEIQTKLRAELLLIRKIEINHIMSCRKNENTTKRILFIKRMLDQEWYQLETRRFYFERQNTLKGRLKRIFNSTYNSILKVFQ